MYVFKNDFQIIEESISLVQAHLFTIDSVNQIHLELLMLGAEKIHLTSIDFMFNKLKMSHPRYFLSSLFDRIARAFMHH